MKILVIGGAGYIGSSLVPKLVDRGYEVDVVDEMWFGNHLPKGVKTFCKDAMTLEEKDFEGYDCVFFLAGLSNDPMAEYSPALNFSYNAALPTCNAYMAKRAGVKRFIFACSCSVYGYTVNELFDEKSPATSIYPYGISKLQGEFGVLQQQDKNFSVISLRKGTVCGYSPRMRLDLVINTMFRSAIMEGVVKVSNPSIWRPILGIKDAVSGYIRALEAPPSISGIFNVASENYTLGALGDFVQEAASRFLKRDVKLEVMNKTDFRNYKVTCEKAKDILGFIPVCNVSSIVQDLVENYDKFKDFDNSGYYNIQVFKALKLTQRLAK